MQIIIKRGKLNNGKFRAWIFVVKDPEDHWLTDIKILKKPPFTSVDNFTKLQTDDWNNEKFMNEQIDNIIDNAIENLDELKKSRGWGCVYDTQIIKI